MLQLPALCGSDRGLRNRRRLRPAGAGRQGVRDRRPDRGQLPDPGGGLQPGIRRAGMGPGGTSPSPGDERAAPSVRQGLNTVRGFILKHS